MSILKGEFQLFPGDVVHAYSGGSGGFGDPFERDPQSVALDLKRGYVTNDAARTSYGVSLTDALEVCTQSEDCRGRSEMSRSRHSSKSDDVAHIAGLEFYKRRYECCQGGSVG